MLFSADAWPGLADGSIDLTFRTWSRPQAREGGRYRVGGMLLEAVRVEQVPVAAVTDAEARRAGEPDVAALRRRLHVPDDALVWRIELRCLGADDRIARRLDADLDADTVAALRRRLERLDAAADGGPWTLDTLRLLARRPGVVSTELAAEVGRERFAFKADVRKLKELGLTESLRVGYRISPRGEALLRALGEAGG